MNGHQRHLPEICRVIQPQQTTRADFCQVNV